MVSWEAPLKEDSPEVKPEISTLDLEGKKEGAKESFRIVFPSLLLKPPDILTSSQVGPPQSSSPVFLLIP